jgi:hypothetical protein
MHRRKPDTYCVIKCVSQTTLFETTFAAIYAYFGFMPQVCGIITCSAAVVYADNIWELNVVACYVLQFQAAYPYRYFARGIYVLPCPGDRF